MFDLHVGKVIVFSIAQALQSDADLQKLFINATIVHAHPHGTGAQRKLLFFSFKPIMKTPPLTPGGGHQ